MSLATMISRILGVAREMVMARYFGAGLAADAFNVAYRIPNLFRDLFAEGALSSAFVPTFIREMTRHGKARAWLLASMVINMLLVLLGGLTLLFYFGARWFVYLLASGFAEIPNKFDLTAQMTQIMSPFLLCVALAAATMGLLNACGSFFVPALAPSVFNVACILAAVLLSPYMEAFGLNPVVSMAIGAALGGALQFLVQIPSAHAAGFRFRFVLDISDPGMRQIVKLMLPAVLGLAAMQINVTVDSQIASRFGNGPVSWLNYAFRLMQLPIGLFGVAIATATLASVSHHAAQGALLKLKGTIASSLRLAACLTFPSTVGLIIFRKEIIRLLYERGEFLPADTVETSRVLLLYALALFAYSAVKILVPTFYALEDTRTPVRASLITVVFKVALNFILIMPLGYLGLALSTAMASWMNFGMLLRQLLKRTDGKIDRFELRVYGKIGLSAGLMGCLAWVTFQAGASLWPTPGFWSLAARLGAAIIVGAASTLIFLRLFGVHEARELTALLTRRIRRAA